MNHADSKALDVGRRVLSAFAAARERVNALRRAAGARTVDQVRMLAAAEQREGKPARGRARRIAFALGITERHARRILDKQLSKSETIWDTPKNATSI